MNQLIHLKSIVIPSLRGSIRCPPFRRFILFVPLLLICFALSQKAQALNPPPDGGYLGQNTAEGTDALFSFTPSPYINGDNTALGFQTLYNDTTGGANTAIGSQALQGTNGGGNTAVGYWAMFVNADGVNNTAVGYQSLYFCVHGTENVAVGDFALNSNQSDFNVALGSNALASNTSGDLNTATGTSALGGNSTGFQNTANGFAALLGNNGSLNTATGSQALTNFGNGIRNTADGQAALSSNTDGIRNTATGRAALAFNTTGSYNTADGHDALFDNTGSFNTALGFDAGINHATGDNNLYIGHIGIATESNTIHIGTQTAVTDVAGALHAVHTATFIAGISGIAVTGPAVHVSSSGQLGAAASSRRFKDDIKPMDKASEAILALKPVAFRYKKEIDPNRAPQFGLVAEDVEKVNPDLIARDADGKAFTVRYEAVNAMLLNEFLKEHRTVQELKKDFQTTVAQQQKEIQALTARLEEQAAQIQKVSAQLEVSKAAPQAVLNNQ
jgi:hypothetical protein